MELDAILYVCVRCINNKNSDRSDREREKRSPKIAAEENANNGIERRNDDDQTNEEKKNQSKTLSQHIYDASFSFHFSFSSFFDMTQTNTHTHALFALHTVFYCSSFFRFIPFTISKNERKKRDVKEKPNTQSAALKIWQLVPCSQRQSNFNSVMIVDACWYCCVLAMSFHQSFFSAYLFLCRWCIKWTVSYIHKQTNLSLQVIESRFLFYVLFIIVCVCVYVRELNSKNISFQIARIPFYLSLSFRFIIQQPAKPVSYFLLFSLSISIIVVRAT